MTVRDSIYQQYQKWWEAYATLKGWIMPEYREYIENLDFKKKCALDIGCWTGQYLAYLKNLGFKVSGKDSSPTAVAMTQAAIGNEWDIRCEDMYTTDIQPNTFDLITSIRTIHHGSKETIAGMIHKIYSALCEEGKIFITLPNYETNNHRSTFTDKEEIAPWTFIPLSWPEKWLPHSFFTQEEIHHICSEFKNITCELDGKWQWVITWEK